MKKKTQTQTQQQPDAEDAEEKRRLQRDFEELSVRDYIRHERLMEHVGAIMGRELVWD